MEKIKASQVLKLVKENKLTPYNFYNADIAYDTYFSELYYSKYNHDTISVNQKISKLFLDIEVDTLNADEFPHPSQAKYPVNAVTTYFTEEKKYISYYVLPQNCSITKEELKEYINTEAHKPIELDRTDKKGNPIIDSYFNEDETCEVKIFKNGPELVLNLWKDIKEKDPAILSSFNGHTFDFPYLYQYLMNYFYGDDRKVSQAMSKFNQVKLEKTRDRAGKEISTVKIPEFPIVDMLYCYLPRAEGGLNLGKTQSSYKLDYIAYAEMGLRKLEYASKGMTISTFYHKDPKNFLLYNVYDVALIVKLDRKLGMIDLYNLQRRKMRCGLSAALRGASPLYSTYAMSMQKELGNYTRWNIIEENKFSIPSSFIDKLYKPKGNIKWTIKELTEKDVSNAITHYPGAYVKDATSGIYNGILCDLDASRLYPSMIIQYNIGIDTFKGRILNSFINKLFGGLLTIMNPNIPSSQLNWNTISTAVFDNVTKYTDDKMQKNELTQKLYIIIMYLFHVLHASKERFGDILQPKTQRQYIILRTYLNTLIEIFEMIHPESHEYNDLMYKYIVNNEELDSKIYIVENYVDPNMRIIAIDGNKLRNYMDEHNYGVTMTGGLFLRHETKVNMFANFLNEMYKLRKEYKKLRAKCPEGSDDYVINDRKQACMKVLMNTTYGLLGMSSFPYSSKMIAATITTCGRVALKTAQVYADQVIDQYVSNINDKKE